LGKITLVHFQVKENHEITKTTLFALALNSFSAFWLTILIFETTVHILR